MERDVVFGKKLYYICLNNKKLLNTIKEKEKQGRRQFFFLGENGKEDGRKRKWKTRQSKNRKQPKENTSQRKDHELVHLNISGLWIFGQTNKFFSCIKELLQRLSLFFFCNFLKLLPYFLCQEDSHKYVLNLEEEDCYKK